MNEHSTEQTNYATQVSANTFQVILPVADLWKKKKVKLFAGYWLFLFAFGLSYPGGVFNVHARVRVAVAAPTEKCTAAKTANYGPKDNATYQNQKIYVWLCYLLSHRAAQKMETMDTSLVTTLDRTPTNDVTNAQADV